MNDVSLIELENARKELLEKYSLDIESISTFKSKIKSISKEEADNLGKELFEIISKRDFKDDFEQVIELIINGANLEYKDDKKGNFSLLVCARKNYLQTFIVLIKAGANINQVNDYLTTATMASARHGNKEILEILILLKADINARCLDGDNALMSAKRHNQVECFDMLVDASCYLDNRNINNESVVDLNSTAKFDLSKMPSSVFVSEKSDVSFEDMQMLIDEARDKMLLITKR